MYMLAAYFLIYLLNSTVCTLLADTRPYLPFFMRNTKLIMWRTVVDELMTKWLTSIMNLFCSFRHFDENQKWKGNSDQVGDLESLLLVKYVEEVSLFFQRDQHWGDSTHTSKTGSRKCGLQIQALNWISLYLNSCLVAFQRTLWITLAEEPRCCEGKGTGLGMQHCTSSLDFSIFQMVSPGSRLELSGRFPWSALKKVSSVNRFCEQVTNSRLYPTDKPNLFLLCSFCGFNLKHHLRRFQKDSRLLSEVFSKWRESLGLAIERDTLSVCLIVGLLVGFGRG